MDKQNQQLNKEYELLIEENNNLKKRQEILYRKYKELTNSKEYKMGKHLNKLINNPTYIMFFLKKALKYIKKNMSSKEKINASKAVLEKLTLEQLQLKYPTLKRNKDFKLEDFKDIKDLNIGCIMDEFSYLCFKEEARFIQLHPEEWKAQIQNQPIQCLFIESAWRGNQNLW